MESVFRNSYGITQRNIPPLLTPVLLARWAAVPALDADGSCSRSYVLRPPGGRVGTISYWLFAAEGVIGRESRLLTRMAKKPKRRSRGFSLRRVRVQQQIILSTLAAKDLIGAGLIPASTDTYRLVSLKGVWTIQGLTAGEGPILVGVARGGYSDAEVEEAIEASNIDRGTPVQQERARRLVREIGVLTATGAGTQGSLNDGNFLSTKLNWLIPIGEQVTFWAYNLSTSLLSTGASVDCIGNAWVKDT